MNSGIIGLIILVSILGGILVLILMKSLFEEKKLKKLIGQDLTSYTKEELLELEEKYEKYDYSSIFKKESERIRVEFEKRINNKNDIKNMIVFDPKGEPYNGFIKKILINKEKKEQLKAIVNAAVYIDNYYSKFIRNVFRDAHNNFKKGLFRQINIIDISDYNFLFYVSDCLHNVPEIIMSSLRLIDCEENEIIDIPFIYLLLQREIQCLKNIINTDDDRTRKEMKIKDNIHILYYIQELNRMDAAIDDLLLNIQKFMEGESL